MEKTNEKPLFPWNSYLVLSSWRPDIGFSSRFIVCCHLWPLSEFVLNSPGRMAVFVT